MTSQLTALMDASTSMFHRKGLKADIIVLPEASKSQPSSLENLPLDDWTPPQLEGDPESRGMGLAGLGSCPWWEGWGGISKLILPSPCIFRGPVYDYTVQTEIESTPVICGSYVLGL